MAARGDTCVWQMCASVYAGTKWARCSKPKKRIMIPGIVSQPHTGQKATMKEMSEHTEHTVAIGMACGGAWDSTPRVSLSTWVGGLGRS